MGKLSINQLKCVNSHHYIKIWKIMKVQVIIKSKHPLPQYATEQSAGMDLRANLNEPHHIVVESLVMVLIRFCRITQ